MRVDRFAKMKSVYLYAITRDFGFAPNPFHGVCTLATCKPKMRSSASIGDWIVGMGGSKMGGKRVDYFGRCICALRVGKKISFNDYWNDPVFSCKKAIRNGSLKTLVGDNVYSTINGKWIQSNCHHSNADGTTNYSNLERDTGYTDQVIIADRFFYFGKSAPRLPKDILDSIPYQKNPRDMRRFRNGEANQVIDWIEERFHRVANTIVDDPFLFESGNKRYSAEGDIII